MLVGPVPRVLWWGRPADAKVRAALLAEGFEIDAMGDAKDAVTAIVSTPARASLPAAPTADLPWLWLAAAPMRHRRTSAPPPPRAARTTSSSADASARARAFSRACAKARRGANPPVPDDHALRAPRASGGARRPCTSFARARAR